MATKWTCWKEWRLEVGSVMWTSIHQGQSAYSPFWMLFYLQQRPAYRYLIWHLSQDNHPNLEIGLITMSSSWKETALILTIFTLDVCLHFWHVVLLPHISSMGWCLLLHHDSIPHNIDMMNHTKNEVRRYWSYAGSFLVSMCSPSFWTDDLIEWKDGPSLKDLVTGTN